MDFELLRNTIDSLNELTQKKALQNVNTMLSIRNWLIGFYIVNYEQNGADRAKYGEHIIENLADELKKRNLKGMSYRNLQLFKKFYYMYPQIVQTVSAQFKELLSYPIKQFVRKNLNNDKLVQDTNQSLISNELPDDIIKSEILLKHFSFSHFIELMKCDNYLERTFYEIEGIKGNWSVRQLKRQIESKLYERAGLSKNKILLINKIQNTKPKINIEDTIRNPYLLEFTGLKELPEYSENDLETALLNNIQEFLLELGDGFCFESRQKRISIENEHDRIDLVFYHRILKCHILIDLKTRAFQHTDAGQMNFYLNYYKDNIMIEDDNLPVGIILCTENNQTKVKYATSGMDNKVFVSKYLIELPSEYELEQFIKQERVKLEI